MAALVVMAMAMALVVEAREDRTSSKQAVCPGRSGFHVGLQQQQQQRMQEWTVPGMTFDG